MENQRRQPRLVQQIFGLPSITYYNIPKIHEFYEKLLTNVQLLETMGKLNQINECVQITLDKLQLIRADLVRLDTSWQKWTFPQLVEALREWTIRNSLINQESRRDQPRRKDRLLQINQRRQKYTYCNVDNHISSSCNKITTVEKRKKILKEKKLCYNCTGKYHNTTECRSKRSCNNYNQRHHTSICNKKMESVATLNSSEESNVICPVVVVLIKGIKCRALLDWCRKFLHFFDYCKLIEKTTSQEGNRTDRDDDEFNNQEH